MILTETCFTDCINSSVRSVKGRVELYNGSTLLEVYKHTDKLKGFTIERTGVGKFFGYGISQKLNAKILDIDRSIDITTDNTLEAVFGTGNDFIYTFPLFYVTEVYRDENTNELSITAYDALHTADTHTIAELTGLVAPYTIAQFAAACARFLGVPMSIKGVEDMESTFNFIYPNGANFEGTETLRAALDAIAEATQTIYYIDSNWNLTFKKLDITGAPVLTIDKEKYFDLQSSTNRRLATIVHATDLGDNVSATTGVSGSTQYIRNNPFWELRDDIGAVVDNALAATGGLTINQFECKWRGNYLLEIGDKIALISKDDEIITSYLLDDTIDYNGAFAQSTRWSYEDNEGETANNPTSLGEALKQTYARVDKANKEITILASETNTNKENISSLLINTDTISATVSNLETATNEALEQSSEDIATLKTRVDATLTAEDVKLEIQTELANGTSKVTTNTGFTFNDEGLTVEKSDSEIKTQITEDGMQVFRSDEEVLTANNFGVNALNLHATNYLIIDNNSRFEDYKENRTACFYVGS